MPCHWSEVVLLFILSIQLANHLLSTCSLYIILSVTVHVVYDNLYQIHDATHLKMWNKMWATVIHK